MKRFAIVAGCVTALALAAAPISLAADVPADVQVEGTTDVYTGETASASQTMLGAGHATSLRLPPGSSATSPTFCIDLDYPTFRFFVQQVQAKADAGLQVDVIYPDVATKNVRTAATVNGGTATAWTLAKNVQLQPATAGKQAGWRRVALRFSVPLGKKSGADWRIDDVLVDPRCRF
jgi:hypothetical protein